MTPPNARPKGSGSLYQRTNGHWIGAVSVTDELGHRKRVTVGAKDRDAAEAKLDALIGGVRLPANLGELREVQAAAWDEGALWAAVECGAIKTEGPGWLTGGDNPYRG